MKYIKNLSKSSFVIMVLFIPTYFGIGCKSYEVSGRYKLKAGMVEHDLEISADSTFKLTIVSDLATSHSKGKWSISNKVINFKSYDRYKAVQVIDRQNIADQKDTIKLYFYQVDRKTPLEQSGIDVFWGSNDEYSYSPKEGKVILLKKQLRSDSLIISSWGEKYSFKINSDNNSFTIIVNEKSEDFYYLDSLLIKKGKLEEFGSGKFFYKKQ